MRATLDWPHPIYIRLGKGGDPVVSKEANGFEIGKAIVMRPGESGHPLLISCGVMTAHALAAADILAQQGVKAEVIHVHTIKPLDNELLLARIARARLIVTVEEHSRIGGLGSAVSDLLDDQPAPLRPVVRKLGLQDSFSRNYGLQDDLLRISGLMPEQIAAAVFQASGTAM
jgi:transketolase